MASALSPLTQTSLAQDFERTQYEGSAEATLGASTTRICLAAITQRHRARPLRIATELRAPFAGLTHTVARNARPESATKPTP